MIEKTLHTANIASAIAAVATATDLTLTGGMGTAIGAALSGVTLFKSMGRAEKKQAKALAEALDNYFANSHLTEDRKTIVKQVFARFPPDYDDFAAGDMNAAIITKNMCKHVNSAAKDPAFKTPVALDDYTNLLTALLEPVLKPNDQIEANTAELLRRVKISDGYARMQDEGITEKAIIRLASKVAEDVEDLAQAWTELDNAIDIAVRVQKEGNASSNHGDFVDEVLRRVAEIAKGGEYAQAGAEIDAALIAEDADHTRRKDRLLQSGVELALLDRDADKAAALLVARADLEAGGQASFEALRTLQDVYYERGRDMGIALDLEVSIALANTTVDRAATVHQLGTAKNDLGNALSILGERDSDTAQLEQAVQAYRAALKEFTQDKAPLDWAMTQNNLGNVLKSLGERDSDTMRLEQAVEAYHAALEEWTRDKVPLDWAMTQNNLGVALWALGARVSDPAHLVLAVEAHHAALEEWTQDKVPMEWAGTQNNLGLSLAALGERNSDPARLGQAVEAYHAALKEWSQDKVPLDWAMAQNNLGNTLAVLGERDGDAAPLEQAVEAYGAALEERTQNKVPLDWAMTQENLALLELAFYKLNDAKTHLTSAHDYAMAAQSVYSGASPFDAAKCARLLDKIETLLNPA